MNKSILMGSLVIAIALVPSFAAASNLTPYDVDIGAQKFYNAPGVSTLVPTLSQAQGAASILSSNFVVDHWVVLVGCDSASTMRCLGDIVS